MTRLICPVCGGEFGLADNTLRCQNNHCFDISKYGYVNLLTKGGKKGHGDDRLMVNARRDFLCRGYYGHLKEAVCAEAERYAGESCVILDSGCGEGYYTEGLLKIAQKNNGEIYGIDVSKEALKIGARACKGAYFAVASAYCLPFEDNCFDMVTSLFAPLAAEEFHRVLKDNGVFITVIPLENHLWELKKAIYDTPYKNKPESTGLKGFRLVSNFEIKKEIELGSNRDIKNLFMMTPYYYKTSARDQEKAEQIERLKVTTEFMGLAYRKD